MTILITDNSRTETGAFFAASCGKVSAWVSRSRWEFRVCVCNSSHSVWRGSGRRFDTAAQALAAYKSPEAQAIIRAAAAAFAADAEEIEVAA